MPALTRITRYHQGGTLALVPLMEVKAEPSVSALVPEVVAEGVTRVAAELYCTPAGDTGVRGLGGRR